MQASFYHPTAGHFPATLANWIAQSSADFRARRAKREAWRQTARELSSYSNGELAELGFSRADLPAIARGTYRG